MHTRPPASPNSPKTVPVVRKLGFLTTTSPKRSPKPPFDYFFLSTALCDQGSDPYQSETDRTSPNSPKAVRKRRIILFVEHAFLERVDRPLMAADQSGQSETSPKPVRKSNFSLCFINWYVKNWARGAPVRGGLTSPDSPKPVRNQSGNIGRPSTSHFGPPPQKNLQAQIWPHQSE